MTKEEMADHLKAQIELYQTIALDEPHRDVYRIRLWHGTRFSDDASNAYRRINGLRTNKGKRRINQMTKKRDYFWWIIFGFMITVPVLIRLFVVATLAVGHYLGY